MRTSTLVCALGVCILIANVAFNVQARTASPKTRRPTKRPTAPPRTRRPTKRTTASPKTRRPTKRPTAPPRTTRRPTKRPTAPPKTRPPTKRPTAPPKTRPPTKRPSTLPRTRRPTLRITNPPVRPDPRDPHGDHSDPRGPRDDPRDPRDDPNDPRDPRDDPRDPRDDPRDPRDDHNHNDPRDPRDDPRDPRDDPRDPRDDPRDPRDDPRDPRDDPNDPRDPRDDHNDPRDPRDPHDDHNHNDPRDPRDDPRDPRDDPRDPRDDPRDPRDDPRDPRNDPRDPHDDHNHNDPRDPRDDPRDPRDDPRDPRDDPRDPRNDPNDPRDPRDDPRDPRNDPNDPRDPRDDPRDPRDDPRDPRDDPNDPRDPRDDPNEPRDPRNDRDEIWKELQKELEEKRKENINKVCGNLDCMVVGRDGRCLFDPRACGNLGPVRTMRPTTQRTMRPTTERTMRPTTERTMRPTRKQTMRPTRKQTMRPTQKPTKAKSKRKRAQEKFKQKNSKAFVLSSTPKTIECNPKKNACLNYKKCKEGSSCSFQETKTSCTFVCQIDDPVALKAEEEEVEKAQEAGEAAGALAAAAIVASVATTAVTTTTVAASAVAAPIATTSATSGGAVSVGGEVIGVAQMLVTGSMLDLPQMNQQDYEFSSTFKWANFNLGVVEWIQSDETLIGSGRRRRLSTNITDDTTIYFGMEKFCRQINIDPKYFFLDVLAGIALVGTVTAVFVAAIRGIIGSVESGGCCKCMSGILTPGRIKSAKRQLEPLYLSIKYWKLCFYPLTIAILFQLQLYFSMDERNPDINQVRAFTILAIIFLLAQLALVSIFVASHLKIRNEEDGKLKRRLSLQGTREYLRPHVLRLGSHFRKGYRLWWAMPLFRLALCSLAVSVLIEPRPIQAGLVLAASMLYLVGVAILRPYKKLVTNCVSILYGLILVANASFYLVMGSDTANLTAAQYETIGKAQIWFNLCSMGTLMLLNLTAMFRRSDVCRKCANKQRESGAQSNNKEVSRSATKIATGQSAENQTGKISCIDATPEESGSSDGSIPEIDNEHMPVSIESIHLV